MQKRNKNSKIIIIKTPLYYTSVSSTSFIKKNKQIVNLLSFVKLCKKTDKTHKNVLPVVAIVNLFFFFSSHLLVGYAAF